MTRRILIAHPRGAETQARSVADQLRAFGYEVGTYAPGAKRTPAQKVVLLWSRAATGTPGLRDAARKARASGSLVCVRLDNARPPVNGAHLALNGGIMPKLAWRRALSRSLRTAPAHAPLGPAMRTTQRARRTGGAPKQTGMQMTLHVKEKNSRLFAIALTISLLVATGAGYAYGRYPAFAAPIDQVATAAYTKASEIAALAP